MLSLLIGIGLVVTLGMLVSGCGQQTPTINTSNSQPQGLAIKGVVYSTTVAGTKGAPLAGAVVSLSGNSANQTATTNALGEYLIKDIPDGAYILIVTAEGHVRNTATGVVIKPSTGVPADNTVTVADIQLSSSPIIVSISPNPNAVISQTTTFVVVFNEAMDPSTVNPSLSPSGVRTFTIPGDSAPIKTGWADSRTLLITPEAALISNEAYLLSIDPNTTARDASGYTLVTTGDLSLAANVNFRVTAGGVPGTPSNLSITVGTKAITSDATGADYADVFGAASIGLHWDPSTGQVTGYKVYVANSATGNYVFLTNATNNRNYVDVTANNILSALYGTTAIDPLAIGGYPMINIPLYVKVVAFNGDGESAAASASTKELIPPTLNATGWDGNGTFTTPYVLDNNYYLPAIGTDDTVAYVFLSEPVDPATVTTAAFAITAVGGAPVRTVVSATLLTQSSGKLRGAGPAPMAATYAVVKIVADGSIKDPDAAGPMAYQIMAVQANVSDLAGNRVAGPGSSTGNLP